MRRLLVRGRRSVDRGHAGLAINKNGSSLCLTPDGKREELNVAFVLSIESFEA